MSSLLTELAIRISVGINIGINNSDKFYIDTFYWVEKYTQKGKDNIRVPLIELNANTRAVCLVSKKYIIDKFEKSFKEEKELWEKALKIHKFKTNLIIFDYEDKSDKDIISIVRDNLDEVFNKFHEGAKELTNINTK